MTTEVSGVGVEQIRWQVPLSAACQSVSPALQIFTLLPQVMDAIGEVGKARRNTQFNFDFRGIDDVLNAVGPVLAKFGITPTVVYDGITYAHKDVTTGNKTQIVTRCKLMCHLTFHAPDGSSVTNSVPGEALDYGQDKSTNKAMASGYKYAMFFGLCIPVERRAIEDVDADEEADDRTPSEEGPYRHAEPAQEAAKPKPAQKPAPAADDGSNDTVSLYAKSKAAIANATHLVTLKDMKLRLKAARENGKFTEAEYNALDREINRCIKPMLERLIDGTTTLDALNASSGHIRAAVDDGSLTEPEGKALDERVDGHVRKLAHREPEPALDTSIGTDQDPGDEPWSLGE